MPIFNQQAHIRGNMNKYTERIVKIEKKLNEERRAVAIKMEVIKALELENLPLPKYFHLGGTFTSEHSLAYEVETLEQVIKLMTPFLPFLVDGAELKHPSYRSSFCYSQPCTREGDKYVKATLDDISIWMETDALKPEHQWPMKSKIRFFIELAPLLALEVEIEVPHAVRIDTDHSHRGKTRASEVLVYEWTYHGLETGHTHLYNAKMQAYNCNTPRFVEHWCGISTAKDLNDIFIKHVA